MESKIAFLMDLSPIFKPKSMAVVGISSKNYNHPGNIIFAKNFYEAQVETFGVSPRGGTFEGEQLYKRIDLLPKIPDLAVLAVSAKNTIPMLKEVIELGVKGIITIGGGFAETGKEGAKLQAELTKICIDADVPMIGPNGLGVYSPPYVDTLFLPTERIYKPPKGNVGIVSQSGGILVDQFFLSCLEREIGVSFAVSIGNKAVIGERQIIDYIQNDPDTDVCAFYLEGFGEGEGRQFVEAAEKSSKELIVYPGGQSARAKSVIATHSAALAVDNRLAMDAYRQYSVSIARNEMEALSTMKIYSMIAKSRKNRTQISYNDFFGEGIVIITLSGGHGVICTDIISRYGMKLATFTKQQKQKIRETLNPTASNIASVNNPIDLTGAAQDEDFVNVLKWCMDQDNVKCIIPLLLPYPTQITMLLGRKIVNALSKMEKIKPIINFVPWASKYDLIRTPLELVNLPCSHTVEETIVMAAAMKTRAIGIKRRNARLEFNGS